MEFRYVGFWEEGKTRVPGVEKSLYKQKQLAHCMWRPLLSSWIACVQTPPPPLGKSRRRGLWGEGKSVRRLLLDYVACVAGEKGEGEGREKSAKEGKRKPYPLSPIPLFFPSSLSPFPLPLSPPATEARTKGLWHPASRATRFWRTPETLCMNRVRSLLSKWLQRLDVI